MIAWEAVTPGFLARALGRDVVRADLLLVDDGTNRRARFAVGYGDGTDGTVFLKAGDPAHAALNTRAGGVLNEPRLFRSGAPLPVEHPRVHHAELDEDGPDFLLVMEDVVARGADPRDSTRPYTVAQATDGAAGLARLHGAYWGRRFDEHPELAWVEPFRPWPGMAAGIDTARRAGGERIVEPVRGMTGEELKTGQWDRYIRTVLDGPTTLVHGDAHIGNTYVLPDGTVGFLDWQVVRRAHGTLDLGYFVQGALTVDDRRAHERGIVRAWLDALDLDDEERPSWDEAWLRYRASTVHGLALWLATAATSWQRPEVSFTLAERYAHAFVDLDTIAAIDELSRGRAT